MPGTASSVISSPGPVSAATSSVETTAGASDAGGSDLLFDDSVIHTVSVAFDQADYEAMIQSYTDSGEKDWIEATVTIDGQRFQRVGLRLKGSSSLRGLANGRGVGPDGEVSADQPEGLPWLIRLDKKIEGQSYGGVNDLVIRSSKWHTSLNEAVSLELLKMAGLASQRAIAVRFSVNGSEAMLRLGTENPDDLWMAENFAGSGALYKAAASGDYSYRGTDAQAYADVFDQEAGEDNADLTPLIAFLDFINNSDDATFAKELPERLDVDAFATYLATEQLIGNSDDIDGPGNNSYLYYDPASKRFTVVPWDHNLAFGGRGGVAGRGAQADAPAGRTVNAGDGKGRTRDNALVRRFHADAAFEALYQKKLAELTSALYESGATERVLCRWVALLDGQAPDLVSPATVESEAARIAAYFTAGPDATAPTTTSTTADRD